MAASSTVYDPWKTASDATIKARGHALAKVVGLGIWTQDVEPYTTAVLVRTIGSFAKINDFKASPTYVFSLDPGSD